MSSINTSWTADSNTKASETTSTSLNNATLSGALTVSGATQLNNDVTVGINDGDSATSHAVRFQADNISKFLLWNPSLNSGSGRLRVMDNGQYCMGSSDDFLLYHDGSHSYITNAVGTLKIATETSGIAVTIGHTTSEVTIADNLTVTGTLTLGSGAELTEAELEMLDGITAGTAAASKALVLDSNKDIGTIRNLTIDGTFSDGNYTFDTSGNVTGLGNVTMTGDLTVTGNDIKGSGGTAITMDGSNNITIAGDLTVAGGDIDLSGEASQITLIDNTTNALQIGSAGALALISINTNNDAEIVNFQHAHASTSHSLKITSAVTLTDNVTTAGAGGLRFDPAFFGSYTITNYNYLQFDEPALVDAVITNAQAFSFPANAGTHPAVDSGSAHPDIDTTDAWIKIGIGGTVHYIPAYTDKS